MDNRIGADQPGSPGAGYAAVEAALAALVQAQGRSILQRSGEVRRLLAQSCPGASTEIALIIAAMSAEVPQRLVVARNDDRLPALLFETAKDLQDQTSIDPGLATWVVGTWACALSLPTTAGVSAGAAAPAGVQQPMRSATASAPPTPRSPPAPIAPPVVPRVMPAPDAFPPATRPAAIPAEQPFRAAPVLAAPDDQDDAILLEPLFSKRDLARIGRTSDRVPAAARVTAAPARQTTGRRPFVAPIVIAGICAAVATTGYFARDLPHWFERGAPASVKGVVVQVPTPIAQAPRTTNGAAAEVQGPVAPDPLVGAPAAPAPQPEVQDTPVVAPEPERDAPRETGTDAQPPASSLSKPSIERVVVPQAAAGSPFAVAVTIAGRAGDVISVERRIVDGVGAWPKALATTAPITWRSAGRHDVQVPFRAIDGPAWATIAFTAVSRDGLRSAPRTATVVVKAANAPANVGVAAEPCSATTCGTVVDSREVRTGAKAGSTAYEITVRLDNRQTRRFEAIYRLQAGNRVRLIGNRLVPAGAAAP